MKTTFLLLLLFFLILFIVIFRLATAYNLYHTGLKSGSFILFYLRISAQLSNKKTLLLCRTLTARARTYL
jgi:hypothetical protein